MKDECRYLIIGGSAAATGAITGIREEDPDSPITLIDRERHQPYSRPLISYLLGGKVGEDRMAYREPGFFERQNVRALIGVEATELDVDERTVTTSQGESLRYEKLLIATGGRPIVPADVPGADAQGVFTFTTWDDARRIKAFIEDNGVEEAVVVGGGLIGLKSVEALVALNIKCVVVELADRILSATFDRTASDLAQGALERAGATVRCNTTVSGIKEQNGRVVGAMLRDGAAIPCSLIIFAIGVLPAIGIVRDTRIETDRGILVDSRMAASVEGVYAAGDVAQAPDLLSGEKRCIAILPNAYRQGLIAGANMAGGDMSYEGGMAMNAVDICGVPTISVGVTDAREDGDEVLTALDADAPEYRKLVLRDGRIVGAIFVGAIDRAGIITGLIRGKVNVASFKDLLLTDEFGLISLPAEYRKHLVSGMGIEV